MNDDYLWDKSGPTDPEIARLEEMLGRLRSTPPVPDVSKIGRVGQAGQVGRVGQVTYTGVRFLVPALAAAAVIALMVGLTWQTATTAPSWQVASLSGAPQIGSTPLAGEGRFAVGQTLVTDANSSARVEVSTIGEVIVGSNSRVRLLETRDAHHRLALDRGSLHAIISAPPGQFVVDTPSATATDLGCVYTLRVDEDGSGMLSVGAGWVAFEERGRESFVPAGASSRMDPANGPGTPSYDDADAAFHDALDAFDLERDESRRREALRTVLQRARGRDAMTLWHLIPRVGDADRAAVVDALARHVPAPSSVSRDAVLRLDRAALDAWWNALGLLDTTWWRTWKGPVPR
jgi:FecR-like protein